MNPTGSMRCEACGPRMLVLKRRDLVQRRMARPADFCCPVARGGNVSDHRIAMIF